MISTRFSPSQPQLSALRAAVAAQFGRPVSDYSACELLVQELARQLPARGGRGRATVLRFFQLVESTSLPTRHTLDTLAQYAGYLSFEVFCRVQPEGSNTESAVVDPTSLLGASYADTLERGYVLGQALRPAAPGLPASPQALALAAHPLGQEFVVESMVDLAHLNGGYGQVVREYLRHKTSFQAQIFGYSALFLGDFLAGDEPAWRARLTQLQHLKLPPALHPFPRGRRASALLLAAWHDGGGQLPAATLAEIRQAAPKGNWDVAPEQLPPFYNYFPAGYHFLVMETLFLTGQYPALAQWLALTREQFPELAHYRHNVYGELLGAFAAVTQLQTGAADAPAELPARLTANLATHQWLWDYYQLHWWLAELHFAVAQQLPHRIAELSNQITTVAVAYGMPFFVTVAHRVTGQKLT